MISARLMVNDMLMVFENPFVDCSPCSLCTWSYVKSFIPVVLPPRTKTIM